jgi:hypothetical protein
VAVEEDVGIILDSTTGSTMFFNVDTILDALSADARALLMSLHVKALIRGSRFFVFQAL